MTLPDLRFIPGLSGKRVLLRVDFNVPCRGGEVADGFRIERALPTIALLRKEGARVILATHLGRERESVEPVASFLKRFFPLSFVPDVVGAHARAAAGAAGKGEIVLLENLRREAGEEKNDPSFARSLASLADLYVNEAFSASHRSHASIVSVPRLLPHAAGPLFLEEVAALSRARAPERPALAIVAGAKGKSKAPLLARLAATYDVLFVGGALANDFLKVAGYPIGASASAGADPAEVQALLSGGKIAIPRDVAVLRNGRKEILSPSSVGERDVILDVGPASGEELRKLVADARFILWNGPLGAVERGFREGTAKLAASLAASSATTIVGGGDTIAALSPRERAAISFISTGGGAMLEFLLAGTLPGLRELQR